MNAVPQSDLTTAPGNTTSRATVEALFRHKTAFLVTVFFVLLATAMITVFTPRSYESEMNILVRNARPDYLLSPEKSNGPSAPADVTEERINSEIEVLRSKDIADNVVDPAWSSVPLSQRSEATSKAHEKAVVDYSKHLTVEAVRKSNVIRVSYIAKSPQAATATVDRLLAAFLAKQREIERATGASSFFASEADRYKIALDAAQQELAGFQQNNEVVSVTGKENTLEDELNALDDNIRATQVQITEAADRVAGDKHELAQLPPRLSTQQRSVPNTQAVEQLTALLIGYQNKRTELMTRFQPTDRVVTEVEQEIKDTSAALATARATNGNESTTDINPVYQQVKSTLTGSTVDLAALRGRLGDLTTQRTRLQQQLRNVEGSTVDFSTLQTRVTELQNDYQLYSQKKNEAQIADAMDQQQLVNVAVAERPTYSAKPYRPQILLNCALGMFTAIFLGITVVFFLELGRDTVAAPYELESISRAPVLATVPLFPAGFSRPNGGSRPPGNPARPGKPDPEPNPQPAPAVTPSPSPGITFAGGLGTTAAAPPVPISDIADEPVVAADQAEMSTLRDRPAARTPLVAISPVCPSHPDFNYARPAPPPPIDPARLQPLPVASFDRRQLRTFEELEAARLPPRPAVHILPRAVPAAPSQPSLAPVAAAEPLRVEPIDPCSGVNGRFGSSIPQRSRLSPSQRSLRRRPEAARDTRSYVTYTIDPR